MMCPMRPRSRRSEYPGPGAPPRAGEVTVDLETRLPTETFPGSIDGARLYDDSLVEWIDWHGGMHDGTDDMGGPVG